MNHRSERYEREKRQGLRAESGELIGGLDVMEYVKGYADYQDKVAFPDDPSLAYELGRTGAEDAEQETARVIAGINAEHERRHQAVRDMIKHRPDVLAKYDAKLAAIRSTAPARSQP